MQSLISYHDFTPVVLLILDQVNGLDNVLVVEGGRDTELARQLLDILLLGLVLSALTELLDCKETLGTIVILGQLVGETDDSCSSLANVAFVAQSILLQKRTVGRLFGFAPLATKGRGTTQKVEDVLLL